MWTCADRESMTARVYLDWNATAPLRPQARAAMRAALDAGRQPVVGAWRGARGARADRAGARAGRGAGRRRAAQRHLHLRRHRGECAGAVAGRSRSAATSGRSTRLLVSAIEHPSVLAGGRFDAGAVEQLPRRTRTASSIWRRWSGGWKPLAGQRVRRLADGRQQRDRRDPAGRARRPTSCIATAACCTSMPCRRRAGSRSISTRSAPIC